MTAIRAVTFTTDFGTRDGYVAEMKGSLLAAFRALEPSTPLDLIDVTHEIPRHAIDRAAQILPSLLRAFAQGTVHVVVVDPEVGTARRPLAIASGGQYFVGPDNGVFTGVLSDVARAVAIADRYRRPSPGGSRVFDGRDLFAPAAAALAAGRPLEEIGSECADLVRLAEAAYARSDRAATGSVAFVDGFGNVRTSIPADGIPAGATVVLPDGSRLPILRAYADAPKLGALALVGSDGAIEIAVNGGSAAERFHLALGAAVKVCW